MMINARIIVGILRKDFFALMPLVALAALVYFIVPMVASLDLESLAGDSDFWRMLQANIYWLGFLMSLLLSVSVLQTDPADSVNHDWLSRPVSRLNWLLAKVLFLVLFVIVPTVLARVVVNLGMDLGPGLSIWYALGIEELETLVLLPLLVAAALLASSIRKVIVLLVMAFLVFLIPGWSVTRPLFELLGISLATTGYEPLMWLQGVFVVGSGMLGVAAIFWLQYCRRNAKLAIAALWIMILAMYLSVYPPTSWYNWDTAIALNTQFINADGSDLQRNVVIDQATACFPATTLGGELSEQEANLLAQANWPARILEATDDKTITFATPINYRESLADWFTPASGTRDYSVEWRFDRMRRHARFSADSLEEDFELQRSQWALNRFEPISATETDYWLLPGDLARQLAQDSSTRLSIEITGSLLSPSSHELPLDGKRYDIPELGSCKAERDGQANAVHVECLNRGIRPELMSAQFIGMDSSRVDNSSIANYTHDWIESLNRERYELTLHSPSLVNDSSIMITAYNIEEIVTRELVISGVLGDAVQICPLPGDQDFEIERASGWSDRSSHEVSYISTEPGVRLEVLDWRNPIESAAPTLLLLPGLGATAHSYDQIAEKLAERYNVIAITRRGVGDSSKPDRGYRIDRLGDDVLAVMDTLGIESAVLVGHSFGGEELSHLGAEHGDRVSGLIYLDAAYDRVTVNSGAALKRQRELSWRLPQAPHVRPAEARSYESLQAYMERTGRSLSLPEGEIIASRDLATGGVIHETLYLDALMRGLSPPDYKRISAPALALYAVPGEASTLMESWYDEDDPEVRQIIEELYEMDVARKMAEIQRFESEVSNGQAVVLEDADHWIFLSHEEQVLELMHDFVQGLPQSPRIAP